ncbi:MAG: rhomboid family intramembrane serine protease [Patescibacteria group bacterium]
MIASFALTQYQPLDRAAKPVDFNQCLDDEFPQCVSYVPYFLGKVCAPDSTFFCHNVRIVDDTCLFSSDVINRCHSKEDRFYLNLGFTPALFKEKGTIFPFITALFLERNFLRLLFNLICFFLVGAFIEKKFGGLRLFLIYIFAGIGGSLLYYFLSPTSTEPIMGMSASVFTLIGVYLALDENFKKYYKAAILLLFASCTLLPIESYIGIYPVYAIVFLIGVIATYFLKGKKIQLAL